MPDLPVRQSPVGGSHTEAAPDGNSINAPSADGDEHNCFPLKKLPGRLVQRTSEGAGVKQGGRGDLPLMAHRSVKAFGAGAVQRETLSR